MKRLFKCLGLFVGWLQSGLYDFSSLPISVFKHLKCEDVNTIMTSCSKYSRKLHIIYVQIVCSILERDISLFLLGLTIVSRKAKQAVNDK